MHAYSSAKLELMRLKWAVCDKFRDYLIGSKFTVYTDNNPLVHVKTSKLGAAQIHWLSELALFDFDIVYHTGHSNRVADALSQQPTDPESEDEYSDTDSDDYHAISYSAVCDAFKKQLSSTKIPNFVKHGVQVVSEGLDEIEESSGLKASVNSVTVFDQVSTAVMAEHQWNDNQLSTVYEYVEMVKSPPKNVIYKARYKTSRKLLLQFGRLTLKQGVLRRLYIDNDTEYHQLVLPQRC